MLHQAAPAVAPTLPLSQPLREWHRISEELADPTRQRTPHLAACWYWPRPLGGQRLPNRGGVIRDALRVPL